MILGILMLAIAVLTGCGGSQGTSSSSAAKSATSSSAAQAGKDVTIKMLNVGQGDSILIQTAEQTVLIDTSDVDERDKFKRELDKAGVKKIDKVILTHPHADHIGGMDVLLKDYQVGEVYDNGMPSTSKLYIGYMKQLKSKGIKHTALKAGDVLDFGGGVSFKVFYPTKELVEKGTQKGYKHDPNNESIVGKLTYGDFSMLFTGDAEQPVEEQLLKSDAKDLRSTILNGHPHTDVLARYLGQSTYKDRRDGSQKKTKLVKNDKGEVYKGKVYETDKNGTITVTTNGKDYSIKAEEGDAQ